MSEKDIYGNLPEAELNRRRESAREELVSLYSVRTREEGEFDAPDDASEFRDIDPELVTWEGPDDPANPRNFEKGKKWKITMIVSLYTFVSPFASSIVAPAVPAYAREFGITNPTVMSLTVSIFLLGYAIGPLFFAPLSEMYGRVPVMQTSMFFFFVFALASAVSQTTGQMIAFRLIAGIAGSAPLALGAGVLADIWNSKELAGAMALFSLGPLAGPVLAPVISGFIVENVSWRWVFWVLTIVCGLTGIAGLFLFRDETYAVVILNRKAARMRKETGNNGLHTVFEVSRDVATMWRLALTRPFKLLCFHPVVFLLGLYMAFTYGFLYLLFVTFPTLFRTVYGMSVGISGLMYIGPGVGYALGLLVFTPLMQKIFLRLTAANNGVSQPEYRLPPLLLGGLLISSGLFWYGWSAEYALHWIMPLIGAAMFGMGLISVFGSCQSYLIDMNPRYAASAISAATVFRSLFGFAFPLFGAQMYDKLGYGWGNSLVGFLALPIGIIFPALIFRYGKNIRAKADARLEKNESGILAKADEKAKAKLESRRMSAGGNNSDGMDNVELKEVRGDNAV
ncbi:MFS general substrate transporter [Ascobolus immersus RN42]|uniref:MFS general substrate transporter n=1 Tax=Ascobolus immersus RN42 TaxID=1160509 RepID=A0A3N4IB85_ASCIM|nr:MFS general substrate transporter [Ascobolus immersus RN42]